MTLTLFFVFPTFVNSFVLPNQQMQLEVYDSAPLVQFPARHSGRLEVEDWVDPEPVIFNEYYEYYEYY